GVTFIMQKIDSVLMNKPQQIIESGRATSSILQGNSAAAEAEHLVSKLRADLRRNLEIRRREDELFPSDKSGSIGPEEEAQDDLLPLYRKRQFESDLPALLSEAGEDAPLSLLFIDLDHFKQVNDNHGHLVGNEVLIGVASATKAICAAKGRCYRWGGEELAVLLTNYTCAEAASLAERIRNAVSKLAFKGYSHHITVSVGVACYPETSGTSENLIEQADKAMYQAK